MSDFLGIHTKTLENSGFQFYWNGLIHKLLEAAGMENCCGFKIIINFEARPRTDNDGTDDNRDSYAFSYRLCCIWYQRLIK